MSSWPLAAAWRLAYRQRGEPQHNAPAGGRSFHHRRIAGALGDGTSGPSCARTRRPVRLQHSLPCQPHRGVRHTATSTAFGYPGRHAPRRPHRAGGASDEDNAVQEGVATSDPPPPSQRAGKHEGRARASGGPDYRGEQLPKSPDAAARGVQCGGAEGAGENDESRTDAAAGGAERVGAVCGNGVVTVLKGQQRAWRRRCWRWRRWRRRRSTWPHRREAGSVRAAGVAAAAVESQAWHGAVLVRHVAHVHAARALPASRHQQAERGCGGTSATPEAAAAPSWEERCVERPHLAAAARGSAAWAVGGAEPLAHAQPASARAHAAPLRQGPLWDAQDSSAEACLAGQISHCGAPTGMLPARSPSTKLTQQLQGGAPLSRLLQPTASTAARTKLRG